MGTRDRNRAKKKQLISDTGDKEQLDNAKRSEDSRKSQRENDLNWLMSDQRGRRIVHDLIMSKCGIQHSSYLCTATGRGSDPIFKEGERNVGLTLLSELSDTCPRDWLLAQAEALEKRLKNEGVD